MRKFAWLVPALLALGTSFSVCSHGIPILRHDWSLPIASDAFPGAIASYFQPWILRGIGEPNPYPTTYFLGFVLYPFSYLGPSVLIPLMVFGFLAAVSFGGYTLGVQCRAGILGSWAASFVAVLNPWVYTEFVAGHITMVFSYAVFLWLMAEFLREKPRIPALVLLCALTISQLEFFVFALPWLAGWLIIKRWWLPLIAMLMAALPIAYGIFAHYGEIAATPYELIWQEISSIPFFSGLVLRGYPPGYDLAFSAVGVPLALLTAFAFVGAVINVRIARTAILPVIVALLALFLASGSKGPLGPLYLCAVQHTQASGLFRELYDVLAFFAIGITLGVASLCRQGRLIAILCCVAGVSLVLPWILRPPSDWFVPQSAFHATHFDRDPDQRVALYPAFQPLSLDGKGSGYDPDLFAQGGRAVPINTFFARFPEVNALREAQLGDIQDLRGLGVSHILIRPMLRSDPSIMQHVFVRSRVNVVPKKQLHGGVFPVLGIIAQQPHIATIARDMSSFGIFFADSEPSAFLTLQASRNVVDPARGWIDARLAYLRHPEIATRFGGAFTDGSTELLRVPRAGHILAWTDDRLLNQRGATILRKVSHLIWATLPRNTNAVLCRGACAVVGVGSPPSVAAEGPVVMPQAMHFTYLAPWLINADLPAHPAGTIRWATLYEQGWSLIGVSALRHERIDEVLNAWTIEAGPARRIILVEKDVAFEVFLELLATLSLVVLFFFAASTGARKQNT